jgi:DNA-directed RNA polymerase subunit RPC12/RpoP
MIHFRCPLCARTLEAGDDQAGKPVKCPHCRELSVAPAATDAPPGAGDAAVVRRPRDANAGAELGLFAGMSRPVRWAAGSLAVVALLGFLLALLHALLPGWGVSDAGAHRSLVVAACSCLLFLVVLHGQGTNCPACGKWWSRAKLTKEFVGRDLFEKEGVLVGKSVYRTTYLCDHCGHRWQVSETDEYPASVPGQPRCDKR